LLLKNYTSTYSYNKDCVAKKYVTIKFDQIGDFKHMKALLIHVEEQSRKLLNQERAKSELTPVKFIPEAKCTNFLDDQPCAFSKPENR
jgi:hypothetical protein